MQSRSVDAIIARPENYATEILLWFNAQAFGRLGVQHFDRKEISTLVAISVRPYCDLAALSRMSGDSAFWIQHGLQRRTGLGIRGKEWNARKGPANQEAEQGESCCNNCRAIGEKDERTSVEGDFFSSLFGYFPPRHCKN